MPQLESHEALVREIADIRAKFRGYAHERDREEAKTVLSLVAERLGELTEEQLQAAADQADEHGLKALFRAMLAASPLTPGDVK